MINDEFEMMYDNWMIDCSDEIKKSYSAKDLLECVNLKYSKNDSSVEKANYLHEKIMVLHRKLSMMLFAEYNIHKTKLNFESTQNMDFPVLYGMGETILLFYLESMIIFARNALDVSATIYSDLFLDKRLDSFNQFSKQIMKSNDSLFLMLKGYFNERCDNGICAYTLLCGSKKGRALRDIIIHQANVKLTYDEYEENCEKERLFLMLKDSPPIDFENFVYKFIKDVEEIFNVTTTCCKEFLNSKYE